MWSERAFTSIIILGFSFLVFSFLVLNDNLIPSISSLYWKVRLGISFELNDAPLTYKDCPLLNKADVKLRLHFNSAGTESEIRFLPSLESFISVITVRESV